MVYFTTSTSLDPHLIIPGAPAKKLLIEIPRHSKDHEIKLTGPIIIDPDASVIRGEICQHQLRVTGLLSPIA